MSIAPISGLKMGVTEAPTLFEFVELEQRLSDLLGVRVDLVMRSALKPHIGQRILSEVVNL